MIIDCWHWNSRAEQQCGKCSRCYELDCYGWEQAEEE